MRVATFCLSAAALPTFLALAACQPAPEDGTQEQPSPENIAEVEGTASGDIDTPPSASAPVESAQEPVAMPDSNARWFIDKTRAAFGPPESEAMLSIRCEGGTLTVQRIVGRRLEGNLVGNMNFLGNDANTLVRVTNQESELGGSLWQGEIYDAELMAQVIGGGNETIEVNIEGENAIRVRPSVRAAKFIRDCG